VSEGPRVAITLDAEHPDRPWCPPGNVDRILDRLKEEGIRATFFVQGRWAEAYPQTARRVAEEGHLVGFHSHYHARMPLLSDDGLASDLHDGEAAVRAATGVDPRPWFRCPFGAGHDDARVLEALATRGYRDVRWHVELQDWEPWRTGADIATDGTDGVRAHGDGAIILLHTWPGATSEGLPGLIDGLRGLGASFVTIDELETAP
jgi:peptidoglycan/xylan/chitin deacetylase (PgdA/CDA1 family)